MKLNGKTLDTLRHLRESKQNIPKIKTVYLDAPLSPDGYQEIIYGGEFADEILDYYAKSQSEIYKLQRSLAVLNGKLMKISDELLSEIK